METPLTPDYTDAKGRPRWHANDRLGELLKDLHDLLVIGGYPPDHAARYPKLGYAISRFPEPIGVVAAEGRLRSIPGIGATVERIVGELIETGNCAKMREPSDGYVPPPRSALELTAVPGLGAKIARHRTWDCERGAAQGRRGGRGFGRFPGDWAEAARGHQDVAVSRSGGRNRSIQRRRDPPKVVQRRHQIVLTQKQRRGR